MFPVRALSNIVRISTQSGRTSPFGQRSYGYISPETQTEQIVGKDFSKSNNKEKEVQFSEDEKVFTELNEEALKYIIDIARPTKKVDEILK